MRQAPVRVFVEGGNRPGQPDGAALRIECARGFNRLIEGAGFAGRMPKIVACGGRSEAFAHYKTACKLGERCLLLVDSEGPVPAETSPWDHVLRREGDRWARSAGASDDDLHFMVECMEAWIVADRANLRAYYAGKHWNEGALPARGDVASVAKQDLYDALGRATRSAGRYSKGSDSFKLLAGVNAGLLKRCWWADRFFNELDRRLPAR